MKTKNFQQNTAGIAGTRLKLGLTQEQLAEKLGISRSMMAMAENNTRSLSGTALIKLANLEIQLSASIKKVAIHDPHPSEVNKRTPSALTQSEMDFKAMRCEFNATLLSAKLERMCEDYHALRQCLVNLDAIMKDGQNPEAETWRMHHEAIVKRLGNCNLHAQAMLRNKISLLQAEAELHKSIQKRFLP